MDEAEEKSDRQAKADLFNGIAYLSFILVGWGILIVLMGLYNIVTSSSGASGQVVTIFFGALLVGVGVFVHFYCKRKAKQWSEPAPGMWELG
jgi:hypothetical protein